MSRDLQRPVNTDPGAIDTRSSDQLLDRILASPHLAQVVPRLQPALLHRVIQHCGLEDCGQLVSLARPGQLAQIFDLDLWRPAAAGFDEHFDADRFGLWLEVMMDADMSRAAATLAAMDVELVAAGFAQHLRVFDCVALSPFVTLDGELVTPGPALGNSLRCEVGGYVLSAKRVESWTAVTGMLLALADAHGGYFNRVMRRCCQLSNSTPEADPMDDLLTTTEQAMFDLALGREERRDTQGYVTPAQARAFLQTSRQVDIQHGGIPPRDPMTRAYFRDIASQMAMERDHQPPELPPRHPAEPMQDAPPEAVAAIVELLHESGVVPRAPRALLEGGQATTPRLARIRAHLQFVLERDSDAYATRNTELAYLANVIAAGAAIQSRPVVAEEASNAAVAVCNLGLENWPARWLESGARALSTRESGVVLPDDLLIRHDLVSVFQVGWTVLHEDVCVYAADRLISVATTVECGDAYIQDALAALRVSLMKHVRAGTPWECRDALEVIAIMDMPAWAGLCGLIAEFPTLHAAVGASLAHTTRQVDASAFEFISENAQIQQAHAFMQSLPAILRG